MLRVGKIDTNIAEAGEGTAILLLHGNPDTHTVWSSTVAHLAPKYRCIAPDLPGFGKTPMPDDFDFSLKSQAAYVRELFAALKLDRVHLVVHDVGGPYGLAFASEEPERLRSLTIFNTNFFPDYHWHFWARVWRTAVLGEIAMALGPRPLFVRELLRGSPRMPREYANHAYDDFTSTTKKNVLRWYRAMDPEVHEGWDQRMIAATRQTPKQVLWGDLDPFLPSSTADRYGGAVQHLADCGHWAMLEEPEKCAKAIAALVASSSAP
jgi:pimeloyl-ACP methyl ester carboxylesterase